MKKKLKVSAGMNTVRKIKKTSQETIPFAELYDNGLMLNQRVNGMETYSLVFSMENTNYSLLKDSDKLKKQDIYISPLNALPDDIHYQEILLNVPLSTKRLRQAMLRDKAESAKTEYDKAYIENQEYFIRAVRQRDTDTKMYFALSYTTKSKTDNPLNILMQQYTKISTRFAELGSKTEILSAEQRLELFYSIYNPFSEQSFILPDDLYKKGQHIQDYIAPSAFSFKPNHFIMGDAYCRCLFIRGFAETIDDEFINELTDNEYRVVVSKHLHMIDKAVADSLVTRRLRELETDNQSRSKRNAERGTTYIPYELKRTIAACEDILDKLNQGEELFEVGVYILISANSMDELTNVTKSIKGICQRYHVSLSTVTMRQEEALNSILPMAQDYLSLNQYLLSSGVAYLLPFSFDRVFSPTGFYYGRNPISRYPIIINRKIDDKHGNGFYLGKPGSGKSMYAKMEVEDILNLTDDDRVIILDPEREFKKQIEAHGGVSIEISAKSRNFINPFEATVNTSEDLVKNKADLILALFEVFKGAPLEAGERTLIDRCVKLVYKEYIKNGFRQSDIPTFVDYDKVLMEQPQKDICDNLHLYLEMYITGTVDVFAHASNVDLSNRAIAFDLRDLGANLKKAGMLIVTDFIQQMLYSNFEKGLWTWIYMDEFQTFYDDETDYTSSAFFEKIFARCRKYGGIATGLTQNITNVLKSNTAVSMLQNSQFVVLLEQATNNLEEITRIYNLSDQQARKLTNTPPGEGLLISHNTVYPFEKIYPKGNIIYDTITTSFVDRITQLERAEQALGDKKVSS